MKRAVLMAMLVLSAQAHAWNAVAPDSVVIVGKPRLYSEAEVYKVWCEPGAPTCAIGDRDVSWVELKKMMPEATWGFCRHEFCYGDRNLSDVVGINPNVDRQ